MQIQVLYQLQSAAQRFLEAELVPMTELRSVVAAASAALQSRSQQWPVFLTKLDSIYDQLIESYTNNSLGNSHD